MMVYNQSSSHTQSAESSTNPSPPLPPKVRRGRALHKASKVPKKPTMINHDYHIQQQQQCHDHHNHHHHHHEYHHHEYLHACLLCPKKFTTSQALGGHQNAHRKERQQNTRFLMDNLQEEIAENDVQCHPHYHHHHDHHDHDHDHHHHDQYIHNQNYNHHGHQKVISPNPLRTLFPLTEYQQVDITPPTYNYGIKLLNPITPCTNWVPPPLPSPAYVLPNWKPYYQQQLPLGLVAQVMRFINPDLIRDQAQAQTQITQPFFPTGTSDVNANNQNVAHVEDNKKIKTHWGLDLKL